MSDTKKLLELVASDENVKKELEKASLDALVALIEEKGLTAEAEKALAGARAKVAEAHGLNIGGMEELDPEELKAVAGGELCHGSWSFTLQPCALAFPFSHC